MEVYIYVGVFLLAVFAIYFALWWLQARRLKRKANQAFKEARAALMDYLEALVDEEKSGK